MIEDPVVITGAAGFIGANLTRRLVADGHEVFAVDIQCPPWRRQALDGAHCDHLDLTIHQDAVRAVGLGRTVFHLAADMGGVGYFHSDADFGAAIRNGRMTNHVLDVVSRTGARTFYASSACAYPIELQRPLDGGEAPLLAEHTVGTGTPDAAYGAEKLHGLRLAAKLPNVRVGILHTVYGPLQEHDGRRMKFPAAACTKAIRARRTGTLELWGDGTQLRSYLYVDDAIDRILRVMDADDYDGPVNIGSTGAVTCEAFARRALDAAGADAEITYNPAEPTGVLARDCDNTLFERRYGPATETPDGVERFVAWLDEVLPPEEVLVLK